MARQYTRPTIENEGEFGCKRRHPSYAKIIVSRVSGEAQLFQSAFTHQHYITLRICRAHVVGNDHEMIMDDRELIEVAMSETQFARMVTSLNIGSGSPCTLQRVGGQLVKQPINEDQRQSHCRMVRSKLTDVMNTQLELSKQIKVWREEKHRPTLRELDTLAENMHLIGANFERNMGYYARVFEEHMEAVVDDAKTEIEAHVLRTTDRLGLTDEQLPALKLPSGEHTVMGHDDAE